MSYQALLALARRDPQNADFSELRLAFTGTRAYAPYGVEDFEEDEALGEALGARDWAQVLPRVRPVLDRCYVRIQLHQYAAAACEALGDADGQRHHEHCIRQLLGSILNSGDGRTPETAFVVIGVWEEYDVLSALNLRTIGQALLPVGDRLVDQMTVLPQEGAEPFALYFDVTIPMAATPWSRPEGQECADSEP